MGYSYKAILDWPLPVGSSTCRTLYDCMSA